ncbi:MAG: hypothetical protein A3I06_00750 [Candidatus Lindowbacteria bacterium RIFCSPLOWO2_02_FULL_62_12]|nr:MAG: hypothetical protein A3I06_00750 [Candidatus Lindowbacteria bacterium RIFCSPLOWO2_02_FULL_62_12]
MTLTVHIRDKQGKGPSGRARRDNRIPAVLYGRGYDTQSVEIDARALQKALLTGAGDSQLIDLVIESQSGQTGEKALIKAIQRHPVTERIQHVDLYRVVMTEKIEVEVPLALTGTPAGIKKGGVLEKRLTTVRVRCLPGSIPEKFVADVAALDVGHSMHVSDLKAPEGVVILNDPGQTLAVVTEVTVEEAPAAAAAAAAAAAMPEAGAAGAAAAPAAEPEKKEAGKEKEKPKGKG